MTRLVIIRHGYSEYNKEQRWTGQLDIPLDEVGFRQADCTAQYVLENYSVDRVYSSDLCRAVATAEPIAKALNLSVETNEKLREICAGEWQGKTFAEVAEIYKNDYETYRATPSTGHCTGGESLGDVQLRALEIVQEIAEENDGKTVCIATHGGVIRALLSAWRNVSLDDSKSLGIVSNASVTVVEYEAGRYTILGTFDKHLEGLTTQFAKGVF